MRVFSVLLGASALALSLPSASWAQRVGESEVYFDLNDLYEATEPEVLPAPVPPPVIAVTPVPIKPYVAPAPRKARHKASSIYPFEDRLLNRFTARELATFTGEREFTRYIEQLDDLKWDSDAEWAGANGGPILIAASMQDTGAVEELCATPEACPEEGDAGSVIVTAQRVSTPAAAATSITNVQTGGVDEGDIVKQIGDHLLVLQDGRIFSINIKDMKLKDRADVYRRKPAGTPKKYAWDDDFDGADWYDEMLVQGDHILITAYSYQDDASEISVFKLDQTTGKVSPQGVFLISADDYYDADNYATRIVGDRLVIYTPYELDQLGDREDRPLLRRWVPPAERTKRQNEGKQLLDARHIYKPVLGTAEPYVHSISICPLGDFARTRNLDCRTTGFVGPRHAEMFVSNNNVYLWNSSNDEADNASRNECAPDWDWDGKHPALPRPKRKDVVPAAVYRLPIRGGDVGVIGVNGTPFDQFSMDESDGQFRALADWRTFRCENARYAPAEVSYLSVSANAFGSEFLPVADTSYTAVPSPGKRMVENRFADNWLVYGGRDGWGSRPPYQEEDGKTAAESATLVAVPVKHPRAATVIELPHNIIRTERVGNDMMVNGYRDASGLNMTLIGLGQKDAHVMSTLFLDKRYESEGRSHAFNAMVDGDGSGLIGVPTVRSELESGRYVWRSDSSDISFVTKAPAGTLSDAGALIAVPADKVATHDSYKCEISCIDWYGNSRPIFTGGRIFGLMGTALVEAKVTAGNIGEVGRIDLTEPILP